MKHEAQKKNPSAVAGKGSCCFEAQVGAGAKTVEVKDHLDTDAEHHGGATCSAMKKDYFLPFFFAFFLAAFFFAIVMPPFFHDKFTRWRKRVNAFF
jgi:hypothetical protein